MKNQNQRLTDQEYQFIYERVPRLCLDFVVVKDNKVLLSKRDIDPFKGYWHLPGGMVYRKESFDDAAKRILSGELGLAPVSKKLLGYIEFPEEVNQNGVHIHSVSVVFLVTLEDGEVRGSDQAREVEYFDSLPEKMHPDQGKFLKENWETIIK